MYLAPSPRRIGGTLRQGGRGRLCSSLLSRVCLSMWVKGCPTASRSACPLTHGNFLLLYCYKNVILYLNRIETLSPPTVSASNCTVFFYAKKERQPLQSVPLQRLDLLSLPNAYRGRLTSARAKTRTHQRKAVLWQLYRIETSSHLLSVMTKGRSDKF